MSVSYFSHAIIGQTVKIDQLTLMKRVKTHPHSYGEEFEFDPKTGKPLWQTIRIFRPELFPDFSPDCCWDPYDLQWSGFDVHHFDALKDEVILSLMKVRASDWRDQVVFSSLNTTALANRFAQFKSTLELHGLWNEQGFGLYSILDCN